MSEIYSFVSKNADPYQISLPHPADSHSFFAFSLVKAGSTLLSSIVQELCALNKVPTVSIYDQAFHQGIATNDIQSDVDVVLHQMGYGYTGFRHYFGFNPSLPMGQLNKILLVRDPKDMLTSLYFSVKYSHAVPIKGRSREVLLKQQRFASELSIDSFVLKNAQNFLNSYNSYIQVLDMPKWYCFKYEDIIESKAKWILELTKILGFTLAEKELKGMLKRFDVFPNEERESEHIRQVWPGNHKKYLSADTIEQLNQKFEIVLNRFNYPRN